MAGNHHRAAWEDASSGYTFPGSDLSPKEVAWGGFVDAKKRTTGIRFPKWSLVLAWCEEFLELWQSAQAEPRRSAGA